MAVKKNFYENPLPKEWADAIAEMERDPEHQRILASQTAGLDYIRFNWKQLEREFVGRWVAVNSTGVVADAPDLDSLLLAIDGLGLARLEVECQFIHEPGTEFIL